MVTKGCADVTWCHTWYGCDPYTMTCVHCCHGNNCNVADNTTQTTTPSQQTTFVATTPRPATTVVIGMHFFSFNIVTNKMCANVLNLLCYVPVNDFDLAIKLYGKVHRSTKGFTLLNFDMLYSQTHCAKYQGRIQDFWKGGLYVKKCGGFLC